MSSAPSNVVLRASHAGSRVSFRSRKSARCTRPGHEDCVSRTSERERAMIRDPGATRWTDGLVAPQSGGDAPNLWRGPSARLVPTSLLRAAQAADDLPFLRRHRLHRQARMLRERHALEPRVGLDLRQRDRFRKRLHRLDVDRDKDALLIGRIAVAFADHLDDADDLLLLAGVVEECVLALLHRL